MAGDMSTDAERAERREAREAAKRPQPRHPDPALDGAELVTVRGKRIKVTDEEFALMLDKAGGFKSRVAKQLGVSVSAVCHRIKRSKFLTETCRTIEETVLDLAEASLIKAAQNGEPWAVTFILKCKGRKRGWIERQDIAFGGDPEALPPPIVIGVHDEAFVERERKRQERDFAEIVDAAVVELKPDGGAEGGETAETSGATGQPLDQAAGDGAEFPDVGAESGPERAETAPETAVPRPHDGGGTTARHDDAARQGANNAQRPAAATPPPKPRTPSEAARMRREQEARERAAGGGGGGSQAESARTRPSFARPMPGAAGRGMRGGGRARCGICDTRRKAAGRLYRGGRVLHTLQ